MIEIIIQGRPIPWTAPKVSNKRTYSPHSIHKEQIQWQMKSQFKNPIFCCPLHVEMDFYFKIPKTISKIRKMEMLANKIHRMVRPDLTNLCKFLEDCGNGILWKDDAIIYENRLRKMYGKEEKSIIRIYAYQFVG